MTRSDQGGWAFGAGLALAATASLLTVWTTIVRDDGSGAAALMLILAAGVATWAFSDLKFQADMGKLLAFMFLVNMIMAMTVLPAFAVWLERTFPRRRPVRLIGSLVH